MNLRDLARRRIADLQAGTRSAPENGLSHGTVPRRVPVGQHENSGTVGTTGTKGTVGTRGTVTLNDWCHDPEERAAIAIVEGGVSEAYADAFAAIQRQCPPGIPLARWHLFTDDAGRFLDDWGKKALALGWTVPDLFGFDHAAPLPRIDRLGLCWLLKGQRVRILDAQSAALSDGLRYRRPHPSTHESTRP